MPTITKIHELPGRPNRVSVHVDGRAAYVLHPNVIARLALREGMTLTDQQTQAIEQTRRQQQCFDKAMRFLSMRLHSRSELSRKLGKSREWPPPVIEQTLDELQRLGYVDDARYARTKALASAEHKHHGRARAMRELLRAGVKGDVASAALDEVYQQVDNTAVARELAMKQSARLRKLDPMVARRRLAGMLQRRGFDYDAIKPVIDEVLGDGD